MKDIALIFASVRPVIVLPTKSQERPSSPFSLLPSRDWRDCRELLFGGTLQTERHFYQPNLLSYQIFIGTQLHFFSNFGQSSVFNRSFEIVQWKNSFNLQFLLVQVWMCWGWGYREEDIGHSLADAFLCYQENSI